MTATMRALGVTARPEVGALASRLDWLERPLPTPGRGEVRVRVMASTVNVDDQHLVEGTMLGGVPVTPRASSKRPVVPGTDVAGVVEAVGPGVRDLEVGARVFGIVSPRRGAGAWSERCVAARANLHVVPDGWSFEDAAALGLSGTVVAALLEALGEVRGTRCLVIGASGGIGSLVTATLAHAGAEVTGVASGRNRAGVLGHGANDFVDYTEGPFGAQLVARGECFDRVVDCLGGRETEREALRVLSRGGTFATLCGPERYVGERKLSFFALLSMFAYVFYRTVASRLRGPRYALVGPLAPDWPRIERDLIQAGIKPAIDRVVPFERDAVREAITYVASHRAQGKVVVSLADG